MQSDIHAFMLVVLLKLDAGRHSVFGITFPGSLVTRVIHPAPQKPPGHSSLLPPLQLAYGLRFNKQYSPYVLESSKIPPGSQINRLHHLLPAASKNGVQNSRSHSGLDAQSGSVGVGG